MTALVSRKGENTFSPAARSLFGVRSSGMERVVARGAADHESALGARRGRRDERLKPSPFSLDEERGESAGKLRAIRFFSRKNRLAEFEKQRREYGEQQTEDKTQ